MIINVVHLLDKEFTGEFEARPKRFPALVRLTAEGTQRFGAAIHVKVRAQRVGNFIEVTGTARTFVGLSCSRCLAAFDIPHKTALEITYGRKSGDPQAPSRPSKTASDTENVMLGVIPFSGDEIDLREGIQEQILMNLPQHPLCKEACLGLCSLCGANRNTDPCDCSQAESDSPFSGLKDLFPR